MQPGAERRRRTRTRGVEVPCCRAAVGQWPELGGKVRGEVSPSLSLSLSRLVLPQLQMQRRLRSSRYEVESEGSEVS